MTTERIQTFEKFWPFYLGEHSQSATRWMHFFGSTAALALSASAAVTHSWVPFVVAWLQGYAFAWVSHFFIEKNRPATFKYPLWSFIADWKMWAMMLTGRINGELAKHGIAPATQAPTSRPAA
jgi:hypothetical protein